MQMRQLENVHYFTREDGRSRTESGCTRSAVGDAGEGASGAACAGFRGFGRTGAWDLG